MTKEKLIEAMKAATNAASIHGARKILNLAITKHELQLAVRRKA